MVQFAALTIMGPNKLQRTVGSSFPKIPLAFLDEQPPSKWTHCLKQFGSNVKS